MKNYVRLTAVMALLVLAGGVAAIAAEDVKMEGGYVWQREDGEKEGELAATFTPDGDGKWNVSFHFDWDDGPHVYSGSCEGSLSGDLSGDIKADGGRSMSFRFNGAFVDGTFTGTHSFLKEDGELKESGTLTLAAAMANADAKEAAHGDHDGHGHDHGGDDDHGGHDDGHGHGHDHGDGN